MSPAAARVLVDKYGDLALAAGVGALFVTEVLVTDTMAGYRGWATLVAAAMSASLAVRRTLPAVPLLAAVTVIQLSHTALPGLTEGGAFMIALLIAIYSAGAHAQRRTLVLTAGLVMLIIPMAALDPEQPADFGEWLFFLVFFGSPFGAGLLFRRRRLRDQEMTERALQAERDSFRLAEDAVAAERVRIARELHDVVSHAISLIVVQSRGGRRTLPEDAEPARRAFDTIEHAGEQALVEMRRMLQVLRTEPEVEGDDVLQPRPGLSNIDRLVADITGAGLNVDVVREGDPVDLPPGVDLSAYRIIQEGLTNVVKHAGPTRAHVLVRYLPDEVGIEVTDDGDGTGAGGGSSYGLAGIRERVGLHGGRLRAGPLPEGGFQLQATLPIGVRA